MTDESAAKQIDAVIAQAGGWRGEMLARLREIIMSAGAELTEAVKWKMPSNPGGVPVWMHGDSNVIFANVLKNSVRLNFAHGPQLKDPEQVFNSRLDSSAVRAIDYFEGDKVHADALKALVLEAAELNSSRGH